jgi:DNA-binding MarR family transcriptional regulator
MLGGISKEKLRDLQLLREIEKSSNLNQRTLAKRLGIALGLTNLCIKRLVNKGYVKLSNVDKRRINYLITPEGLAEKSRLTFEYLKATVTFYKQVRGVISSLFQRLEEEGYEKIVFFGAGEEAEIAYISLHQTNLTLVGVVDENRSGVSLFGFPVLAPTEIPNLDYDVVVVVSLEESTERRQRLIEMGIDPAHIFMVGDEG